MKAFSVLVLLLAALVVLVYVVSLPVFYGLFSFSDYEDWECYASQDSSADVPWDLSLGSAPDSYHNVSDNFHMVNLWGFCNFAIAAGIGCCGLCCALFNNELASISLAIGLGLTFLSYFVHFLTLLVMRWRHAGRVCAGDFNDNLHFYRPLEDEVKPFLHMTGSWLFYSGATQIYLIFMVISGISFIAGTDG